MKNKRKINFLSLMVVNESLKMIESSLDSKQLQIILSHTQKVLTKYYNRFTTYDEDKLLKSIKEKYNKLSEINRKRIEKRKVVC